MTPRVRPCDTTHGRTHTHTRERKTAVTNEELAMLDFAVKWAPFGGGDEHILPEFGVFPNVFYRRLQRLLRHHPTVNDSVRLRLDELCAAKLEPAARTRKRYSRVRAVH